MPPSASYIAYMLWCHSATESRRVVGRNKCCGVSLHTTMMALGIQTLSWYGDLIHWMTVDEADQQSFTLVHWSWQGNMQCPKRPIILVESQLLHIEISLCWRDATPLFRVYPKEYWFLCKFLAMIKIACRHVSFWEPSRIRASDRIRTLTHKKLIQLMSTHHPKSLLYIAPRQCRHQRWVCMAREQCIRGVYAIGRNKLNALHSYYTTCRNKDSIPSLSTEDMTLIPRSRMV